MFKKILQSLTKSHSSRTAAAPAPAARASAPKTSPLAGIKNAPAKSSAPQTPDELCGITPKMPKSEIMDQLKRLYRRHNRGASSLDPKVRARAEEMLHAIVVVREKHFGQI
ncbi:MAG TPA: hypothetical protein DIT64_00470 [Verrucomicrobiales bacterium]|nr:hypothetical protein [Verrucomicrobiales bacterium]HCN78562.1 hypothetical protein [Verrucomicrobiales bacterium]HRJ11005.1 hypothetical protein [Prosthecobacter sp.]HRK15704.1 hypothetical protein [Prosthecobacter sp.]